MSLSRGQSHGHRVRLQVHRDLCRHQPQRGRTPGRDLDADTPEVREPGAQQGPFPQEELLQEKPQPEQVAGFRHRHADRKRAELPEKIQGVQDVGQSESQESVGKSLGKGQQVQVVRESARVIILFLYI